MAQQDPGPRSNLRAEMGAYKQGGEAGLPEHRPQTFFRQWDARIGVPSR